MSYSCRISDSAPAAFIIMIDQSGSMSERIEWHGALLTKAQAVSNVVNQTLAEILMRSRNVEQYRHYFDIAVWGYSGRGVYSLLPEQAGFMTPQGLASSVRRVEKMSVSRVMPNGEKVLINLRHKIWVEPQSDGSTPMLAALNHALELTAGWIAAAKHENSFPPLVINITDSEATDADPQALADVAAQLRRTTTSDGNTLLFNIHIANTKGTPSVMFPVSKTELPNTKNAELIFEMSSVMPKLFEHDICKITTSPGKHNFRAAAYNASMQDLVRLMNIGSTTHII